MTQEEFNVVFELQMRKCADILAHKKKEYTGDNIKFFLCHVIVPPLFCDSYRSRSLFFDLTGSGICI